MNLQMYLANAGVCSRRKAGVLIKDGQVTVNHFPITDPNYEVRDKDTIRIDKKEIKLEEKVYIIFNKPEGCVTTSEDDLGRTTVLDYIDSKERVYPIGRLDYDTTGLLLLTNDGELAQKLSHPKYKMEKIYHAVLDKDLQHKDLLKLQDGIMLPEGFVKVDNITYAGKSKKGALITIHSGQYRVIRYLFRQLGYRVTKLDRVFYAGLSKKGMEVGSWRYLKPKELKILLKK